MTYITLFILAGVTVGLTLSILNSCKSKAGKTPKQRKHENN